MNYRYLFGKHVLTCPCVPLFSNSLITALLNNRFISSNACWRMLHSILAGIRFTVKSVNGFVTRTKFSIY